MFKTLGVATRQSGSMFSWMPSTCMGTIWSASTLSLAVSSATGCSARSLLSISLLVRELVWTRSTGHPVSRSHILSSNILWSPSRD